MNPRASRFAPNATDSYYQDISYIRHLVNKAIFSPLPTIRVQCFDYLVSYVESDLTRASMANSEILKITQNAGLHYKNRAETFINEMNCRIMTVSPARENINIFPKQKEYAKNGL